MKKDCFGSLFLCQRCRTFGALRNQQLIAAGVVEGAGVMGLLPLLIFLCHLAIP